MTSYEIHIFACQVFKDLKFSIEFKGWMDALNLLLVLTCNTAFSKWGNNNLGEIWCLVVDFCYLEIYFAKSNIYEIVKIEIEIY